MFNSTYDDVFPSLDVKVMNYALYLIPIKVDLALNKGIKDIYKNEELDNYQKTLISYGKLHFGCFILSSILKANYSERGIVTNELLIQNELENNFQLHFKDALENFERIMKAFAGNKKESIPIEIRKTELDNRIVRFVKNRK